MNEPVWMAEKSWELSLKSGCMKVFNTSNTWRGFTKKHPQLLVSTWSQLCLVMIVIEMTYSKPCPGCLTNWKANFLIRADHNRNPPKEDLIVTASSPAGGCITATCTSPWHPSDQDVGNNIYWYLDSYVDDGKMHLVVDDSWNMKLTSFICCTFTHINWLALLGWPSNVLDILLSIHGCLEISGPKIHLNSFFQEEIRICWTV